MAWRAGYIDTRSLTNQTTPSNHKPPVMGTTTSRCRDPNRLLLSLPTELLLIVADYLDSQQDVYSLFLTNRRLSHATTPRLHQFATRDRLMIPALHWAAMNGHIGLAKLLLSKGFDVNSTAGGSSPLTYAIESDSVDLVKVFLDNGANIGPHNSNGYPMIHDLVRRIIQLDSDRGSMYSGLTVTPRTDATTRMPEILRLLLKSGLDLAVKDNAGYMPLHIAAMKGTWAGLMGMLLEGGAPVDGRTNNGWTAMHLAIMKGSEQRVGMLISYGADVNARDANRVTPVHMAASRGHMTIVGMLVDAGADNGGMSGAGKTLDDSSWRLIGQVQHHS